MSYYFKLIYPKNRPACSVSDLLRALLIPRKWRHYLRIDHKILINNHYRYFNELVNPGDQINMTFDFVKSDQQQYPASAHMPKVIYEDDNLLVIDKPSGQKTHPNLTETDTALNDCATYLGASPYIVHRLDMLTSGLLLVAKNPIIVPILNRELATKEMHREYVARIAQLGQLAQSGVIKLPIGRDPLDQRKRQVTANGLPSITHYQILKQEGNGSALVKLSLETGRTHQIRVHLAAMNAPIIGDPLYNHNFNHEKMQLLAYQMEFTKPFSFKPVKVKLVN